jgi:ATPase subunit of ABC transporter with duplicated ATPase domains
MISIKHLSMHVGARLLFDEVNINLLPPTRYGLVGANGTGKSTFLRLLAKEDSPSLGEIVIANEASIGFLKQDQFKYEKNTVVETVLQGKQKLWDALKEKETLLLTTDFTEAIGLRLGELEEVIAHYHGYTAETFIQTLLIGLGVAAQYHFMPLGSLSGGFKLRVLLAQALFAQPDILLLDEPTNHLDIMSIAWLEGYLKSSFKGVLLVISHDYSFLNNISTHILDIDFGEIREYVGNYDQFIKDKTLRVEQKLLESQSIERKIAEMRVFVERFRASASRSKQALSREKMIDKLELPDIKKSSRVSPSFSFKQKRPSGKTVLKVEKLTKAFGEKTVLKNINMTIHRGDKIALIGHNGVGKSTLLKLLLAQHVMDEGHFEWGYETHIAYFAQDHHEMLTGKMNLLEWLTKERESDCSSSAIRNALGQMLFTQEDVYKFIPNISGGEAARLLFANIMLQQANIIILDEPTNHLDLESREALAAGLQKFDGTVLFVSHDRHFVSSIATRVVALTEHGMTDFHGKYADYLTRYGEDYLSKMWLMEQAKAR